MTDLAVDVPDEMSRLQEAVAGRWSIERELGRGGMGVVYLARDVALDRAVAIKLLHPGLAEDPEQRARFLAEARTGARLSHPNVIPIYAVEELGSVVFFVMALIDGESAGDLVRRDGPMKPDVVERILREIGWGLAYAHAMNLVHRDVTIDNILIERSTGRAVLADFGIAGEIEGAGDGALIGTAAYIAPEVIQGTPASRQSDLYALGVAAWTMLAGRLPFIADDSPSVLLQHVTSEAPSLARAAPRTPSRLVRAIENALEKDPSARAQSIEAWLELLQASDSSIALAAPLRRWLSRWDLVKPFYALGMSVTAMLTASASVRALLILASSNQFVSSSWATPLRAMLTMAAWVMGVVVVVQVGIELTLLRRLAKAGYGANDLRLALARAAIERRRAGHRGASLLGRITHDIGWLAGGTYVLLATAVMKYFWVFLPDGYNRWEVQQLLGTIGLWSYVAFLSTLGFSFLVPPFHFHPDSVYFRLRDSFWLSRAGDWLIRIAGVGIARTSAPEHTLHRPTELVLDLAIEDLWQALPETTRRSIPETRRIVAALRKRLTEVKDLERSLDDHPITPTAEVRAMRERLRAHQKAGVAALERIRLLLIGLGGYSAPHGEFTAHLDDARSVEQSLLAELGAHRSLWKRLKPGLTQHSLTPTPVG